MATCDTEIASLPILSGCPGANEYFIVTNAVGGAGAGLYGRRSWQQIMTCLLDLIQQVFMQFTIGQPGAPVFTGGGTILTINQTGIISDSVWITLGGVELDRNDNTQISYQVIYNANDIVITLNQSVQNSQLYIIHYAFIS